MGAAIPIAVSTGYSTPSPGVMPAASYASTLQVRVATPGRVPGSTASSKPEQLPLNNTPNLVTVGGLTYSKGFEVTIGNWKEVLPGMAFLSADAGGLGPSPDGTPMMQLV